MKLPVQILIFAGLALNAIMVLNVNLRLSKIEYKVNSVEENVNSSIQAIMNEIYMQKINQSQYPHEFE
jgi:hypothetical protein